MAKLFKGRDRRMCQKALDVINALEVRDARVDDQTLTAALSNRVHVFPAMDAELVAGKDLVKARLVEVLAQES